MANQDTEETFEFDCHVRGYHVTEKHWNDIAILYAMKKTIGRILVRWLCSVSMDLITTIEVSDTSLSSSHPLFASS